METGTALPAAGGGVAMKKEQGRRSLAGPAVITQDEGTVPDQYSGTGSPLFRV